MKTLLLAVMTLTSVVSVRALDRAELDQRVRTLTAKLVAMQSRLGGGIPADILSKAQGIILLDRTRAGFLFAYQGGGGVALVREPGNGAWSPAAFVAAHEASLGFQIGGEQNFFAILLMDTNVTRLLTEPTFDFGGEARGTAGAESAGAEGSVKSSRSIWVYDDRRGLYGGAIIKGGALAPDDASNRAYYEQVVTLKDVLFDGKVKPTEASEYLAARLKEYSNGAKAQASTAGDQPGGHPRQ